MLAFTERLSSPRPDDAIAKRSRNEIARSLALTAEERTRTRYRFNTPEGESIVLCLPRGTVLRDRDVLRSPAGDLLQILAKPEPVLTVTADDPLTLLRAAYHLGNRHVPLEVTATYLRLSPDPVLEAMLVQLGVRAIAEVAPFNPESGAYRHSH
ncbi:urease accessory protein UreE [Oscillatoria sp. FACHB-1406]|uniref:urease accessory protein UreE n=1 Tax=Oscillatoria sp. FACHB-1406 TaxID=2692846 RepID=UPI0016877292|nr:urease accessory protein UreE [Oscillatoria sp. FACHB-1406]MBD2580391.1 urease accessory protein UreE [Oscillatoria sp. FACHB-1406]